SGRVVTAVSAMVPSLAVRCRGARAYLMRYERSPSLINLGNRPGQALTDTSDSRAPVCRDGPAASGGCGDLVAGLLERLRERLLLDVAAQLRPGPRTAGSQVDLGGIEAVYRPDQGLVRLYGDDDRSATGDMGLDALVGQVWRPGRIPVLLHHSPVQ